MIEDYKERAVNPVLIRSLAFHSANAPGGMESRERPVPAGCNVFNYRFKTGAAGFEPAQLQSGRTNQLKAYSQQQQGSNLHTPVEERTNRPPKFAGLSRLVTPSYPPFRVDRLNLSIIGHGPATSRGTHIKIASAGKRSRHKATRTLVYQTSLTMPCQTSRSPDRPGCTLT